MHTKPFAITTALICHAIEHRRMLRFNYDGGERYVVPHLCGLTADTHNEILHAYQLSGYTHQKGSLPEWRNFIVSKITDLSESGRAFHEPSPGYHPEALDMEEIYAKINSSHS